MAYDRRPGRRPSEYLRGDVKIDYKNVELLDRFLEDGFRLRSRRRTRSSAKNQRQITRAVKRARQVALLPFTSDHVRISRREGRRDQPRREEYGDRRDGPRRDDFGDRRDGPRRDDFGDRREGQRREDVAEGRDMPRREDVAESRPAEAGGETSES